MIEMIIYVAILAAIAIVIVSTLLEVGRAYTSITINRDINTSATVALDRMVREIRGAERVDVASSTLDAHPGTLVLHTRDENDEPITRSFHLTDTDRIRLMEDGAAAGMLTRPDVVVTNLVFSRSANDTRSETITIDLTLEASGRSLTKTVPFSASAVTRGAY